ncbi:transcription factor Thi5 [Schizosaccharomyces cryophilus OY26]|uniref:Transcription factor Thi5 n=1 Tax=Schizosaccharomyces cryophilus (strain OY26 / ATCC MYA-4695 / CBS 11777 / NBRC 106824 / NRRL Y48691) TaxID=653667 RepID=S9XJA0_SCHCR|nr:transcription factor Thi5 [Schizosaccharomyces cryophilus OY26]EPY53701.1 transcription factor Thi5 [Schizosaccharomyces cryophilus OY26]
MLSCYISILLFILMPLKGFSSRPLYLEEKTESSKQKRRVPADIRKRIRRACLGCRLKKSRCTGTVPCHSCLALGSQCVYTDVEKERTPSKQYIAELSKRQKCFEYLFEHICPSVPQCTQALVQLCKSLESNIKQGTPLASLIKPAVIDETLCKFSLNSEEETSEESTNQQKVYVSSEPRVPDQCLLTEGSISDRFAKTIKHATNFVPNERLSHDTLGPVLIGPTSSSVFLEELASSLNVLERASPCLTSESLSPSLQSVEAFKSCLPVLLQRGLISLGPSPDLKSSNVTSQYFESLSLLACQLLPSLETARQLSQIFFVRFQCFLQLYPPAFFYKRYQIFYNIPKLPNNLDIGFLIVSMSIMALGQLTANNDGIHIKEPIENAFELLNLSEQLLFFLLPKFSLSTVQGIAIVAFQCLLMDRKKEAYSYVGLAFHIARVIGLEVMDSTQTLDDSVAQETNRRILWSLRVISSFLFLQAGITPIISLFPVNDLYFHNLPNIIHELEVPHLPSTVFYFTSTIKFFSIAVPSLLSIYNPTGIHSNQEQDYAALLSKVKGASEKINEWKKSLPHQQVNDMHDRTNSLFRGSVFLHLLYHHFNLLLFQTVVFYHLKYNTFSSKFSLVTESTSVILDSNSCFQSVQSILSLILLLQENNQLDNCFSLEYEILYMAASMSLLLFVTRVTDDKPFLKCIHLLESMGSVSVNAKEKLSKLKTVASKCQSEYLATQQKSSFPGNDRPSEICSVQEGYLAWKTWIQELSKDSDLPVGHSLKANSNATSLEMDSHSSYEKHPSSTESNTASSHPFLSWHEALLSMDIESNKLS